MLILFSDEEQHNLSIDPLTFKSNETHYPISDNTNKQIVVAPVKSVKDSSQPKKKKKRVNKTEEEVIIESKIHNLTTTWYTPNESEHLLPILSTNDLKQKFFAACDKDYQEVMEGVYILPSYSSDTGKIQVIISCEEGHRLQVFVRCNVV